MTTPRDDLQLQPYANETIDGYFARLDALHDAHLAGCAACNYDEACVACEVGGHDERGHSCNCSRGCDGGFGARLRKALAAARARKEGPRPPRAPDLPAAALVALHLAPPHVRRTVASVDLIDVAIGAIVELNDRLLPAHTREHLLAALDLIKVARTEVEHDCADEPCRLGAPR